MGDQSRRLSFAQRQELTYDRGHAPFDGTAVDASDDELDADLIEDFRNATGATRDGKHLLAARSLTRPDGSLTVAAYLLFGREPSQRMPHAHVRVLQYLSDERGTGFVAWHGKSPNDPRATWTMT